MEEKKTCKNCGGCPSEKLVDGKVVKIELDEEYFCGACYWAKQKGQNFKKDNLTKIYDRPANKT